MGLFSVKPTAFQIQDAKLHLKQAKDNTKLVNTTTKGDVFFGRLNFLLDTLLHLQQYEKFGLFKGKAPSAYYREILGDMEKIVQKFIDRTVAKEQEAVNKLKTQKAKINRVDRFKAEMIKWFDNANTYWQGNYLVSSGTSLPHYSARLYTIQNYNYLKQVLSNMCPLEEIKQIQS
jgi:hypothetical protein